MTREREETRPAHEQPEGRERCPCCDGPIAGLTVTAADGPRVSPCGHRISAYLADRITGAGPAPTAGDAEG